MCPLKNLKEAFFCILGTSGLYLKYKEDTIL